MSEQRFAVIPAVYVYLRRGDDVLLQLRQGTGYMDGMWAAGTAGHIELGETAASAGCREAAEELGIRLESAQLAPLTVMQRTDGTASAIEQRADWFFTATSWIDTPRIIEPSKCAQLEWFSLNALPDRMPPYERAALDALACGDVPPFMSYGF
ncbi:MAG TPA: DNA mismatch repair protein MutT [Microbacterium sp.]|nr:DNA mismatch repair protein MutT [Microbacterium sp.]